MRLNQARKSFDDAYNQLTDGAGNLVGQTEKLSKLGARHAKQLDAGLVEKAVGETATKIKQVKEDKLDLSIEPTNNVETALHIFYDDLFSTLVQAMQKAFGSTDKMPRISDGVPIVLSGGSIMPKGSKEKFERAMMDINLPVKISDIVVAEKPLYATAKGSLKMAMEEGKA